MSTQQEMTLFELGYMIGSMKPRHWEIQEIKDGGETVVMRMDKRNFTCHVTHFASSFDDEQFNPMEYDAIICWNNDAKDHVLPIIQLSTNNLNSQVIVPANPKDKEIYWLRNRVAQLEGALEIAIAKEIEEVFNTPDDGIDEDVSLTTGLKNIMIRVMRKQSLPRKTVFLGEGIELGYIDQSPPGDYYITELGLSMLKQEGVNVSK